MMLRFKTRFYSFAKRFVTEINLKQVLGEKYRKFGSSPELAFVSKSIQFYVGKVDLLVDIGAHKGLFSAAFNSIIPTTKTICVEPNAEFSSIIKENNRRFNVEVVQLALSNTSGECIYYMHEDSTMNSIVESNTNVLKEKFPYDNPDKLQNRTIITNTLDDFISKQQEQVNQIFLKLDTQGNELEILTSGREVLKKTIGCLVEHMFVDAYKSTYTLLDLLNFMSLQGFDLVGVPAIIKRQSQELSSADFLFIKKGYLKLK